MVIHPNNGINGAGSIGTNAGGRTKQAETSSPPPAGAGSAPSTVISDSVSLSSQAHNLAKLEADLGTSVDVDNNKVAQMRTAIASGEYQVNAETIADNMLSEDELF